MAINNQIHITATNTCCNPSCFEVYPGGCIVYQGADIPCLGINNGDAYDPIVTILAEKLCELSVAQTIDPKCLTVTNNDSYTEVMQAVIDKLCELINNEVVVNLSCLSNNDCSNINLDFTYSLLATVSGLSLNWNLSTIVEEFDFYYIGMVDILPGNIDIASSNLIVGGITFNPTQLPTTVIFRIVGVKDGNTVIIEKAINITSTSQQGEFTTDFNCVNSSGTVKIKQSVLNQLLINEICYLKNI